MAPFFVFFVRCWKFFPKVSAPPGLVFSSEEDLRYTLSSVRMVYARMWDVAKFEEGTRCLSIGGCHIRNFFTHQHQPTKVWETETQWEYSLSDTQRSHYPARPTQTISSNMQQCKYAKSAKSAKCSSSDIQHGRCPPQPTQTTASTSSPKPLMSSGWPSVAASQGSQRACYWRQKHLSSNFSGMGWLHSRQNQETYSPSTPLKQELRFKRNGKK